ncbi:hypothetical protein VOLCADRAFT_95748 [Volvox carteri f. nagariensis]|uniref:Uncharacterized protein n=1 Tax=Volvox carteri f. nagariensis TaxID=3068 RepID=D8U8A2_VOLCA|nr:uncharacterized protein VOLCADRAFT_95748 [Volvox carteri f. nagariensis]EFJ44106.1 hypothetical protein VOLCADRAFT_95748 [Volvox carteri f. nagariensis]|eukprot:XP_002954907.1 hypothetical protein VOLCADRAFT_95748 [Volvox carteri f. nagariensis]
MAPSLRTLDIKHEDFILDAVDIVLSPENLANTLLEFRRTLSRMWRLRNDNTGKGRKDLFAANREPRSTSSSGVSISSYDFANEERLHLRHCRHFVNLTNGIEALPMLHELQLPYSFVRIQSTACEQQNLEALISELDPNLLINLALGHWYEEYIGGGEDWQHACGGLGVGWATGMNVLDIDKYIDKYICLVYDCGSRGRNGTPRALWYGLEFVRYTLSKLWLRRPCPALLRGKNVAAQFDQHIRAFRQSTTRRIKYYAKYLPREGPYPLGEVTEGNLPGVGGAATATATGVSDVGVGGDEGRGAGGGCGLQRLRLYGVYRPTDHDDDVSYYVRLLYNYQLLQPLRSHDEERRLELPGLDPKLQEEEEEEEEGEGKEEKRQQEEEKDDGGEEQKQGRLLGKGNAAIASCSRDMYNSGNHADAIGVAAEEMSGRRRVGPRRKTTASGLMCGETEMTSCGMVGGHVAYGTAVAGDDDGEAVLARYGFRLFRRGLSPMEWAVARGTVAAAGDVRKDHP